MRPQLSRSVLDRAAHHRSDPTWLEAAWQRAHVIVVDPASGNTPVDGDPPHLAYLDAAHAPDGDRLYLGGEDEPYFAVAAPVSGGGGLRELGPRLSDFDAGVFTEAVALIHWHADHQYDPRNGHRTQIAEAGWERRDGDRPSWPRTDPAIMVIITDGADQVLLARGVNWGQNRYSCIAGFVEPGESAEAACHREVGEEVGVPIAELSYIASQPWPYPRSLMLGYEAVADPDHPLTLQADEIAAARWFTRDHLKSALAGEEGPLVLPPSISIARYLMERWTG
ncbi:MAG TPA: NAD(+) diphosphatase [Stackebrandtia sp.]|jgi:NAD+ diphosphatase|uniref:NAD(+) diphosphatase n=1 Tax=Stackebrandtia sp. TaxID=2023065 RepID=UPI002D69E282|nr:NAD(+) diphosphatase [Stackebrandtia sp.]HZE40559.1 NAD(+) diphosphatase [Stackebrandtia sp.]